MSCILIKGTFKMWFWSVFVYQFLALLAALESLEAIVE